MADPVLLVDRLSVGTPQGDSGLLAKGGAGYLFGYHADAPRTAEVSLSMPHRMEQYSSAELKAMAQYIGSLPGELKTVPQREFRLGQHD